MSAVQKYFLKNYPNVITVDSALAVEFAQLNE